MREYTLVNMLTISLVTLIIANSMSPCIENCMDQDSSENEQIGYVFFVPKSGQLGCSYYGASFEDRGKIRFFSLEDGKQINLIPLDAKETAHRVANSHDGQLMGVDSSVWGQQISSGPQRNTIGCYSIAENRWLWRDKWSDFSLEETRKAGIQDLVFTSDNKRIVAVGRKSVMVYDAKTGEVLKRWKEPLEDYPPARFNDTKTVFSSNGRYLVVWQEYEPRYLGDYLRWFKVNKEVTVWDVETYRLVARWEKPKYRLCCAAFSADGEQVIFGSADGYVRVWSVSERKIVKEWKAHMGKESHDRYAYSSYFDALTISPNGKYLATKGMAVDKYGKDDVVIKIWDFMSAGLTHEFTQTKSGVFGKYPMAFDLGGEYFAFRQDGDFCLYDTQTWGKKWCIPSSSEEGK